MGISSSRPSTTTPVSPPTVTESGQQSGAILPPEVLRSDQPDLPAAPPGHTASELTHDLGASRGERMIRGAALAKFGALSAICAAGVVTGCLTTAGLAGKGPMKGAVGFDEGLTPEKKDGLKSLAVFAGSGTWLLALGGLWGVSDYYEKLFSKQRNTESVQPASDSPQTGPNIELQRQVSAASELPGVSTQV